MNTDKPNTLNPQQRCEDSSFLPVFQAVETALLELEVQQQMQKPLAVASPSVEDQPREVKSLDEQSLEVPSIDEQLPEGEDLVEIKNLDQQGILSILNLDESIIKAFHEKQAAQTGYVPSTLMPEHNSIRHYGFKRLKRSFQEKS